MIDIKQGIITLCESEFQITADTTPQALTEKIPELIFRADPIATGYTHFHCWLDIEPQCYVWASICFCGSVLESIRLFPQHQSASIPAPQPNSMDVEESHPLAHGWYSRYFEQDGLTFPRGSVQGISKNPSHGESAESFPSFVTKILRIGSTIRADFCLD